MTKTIKFNLKLDGNPVRTLEGLQDNFNIEDILMYYHCGVLQKWLKLRGYHEEAAQVAAIGAQDTEGIIKALAKIFQIEVDDDDLDAFFKTDEYKAHLRENMAKNKADEKDFQQNITSYLAEYDELITSLKNVDSYQLPFSAVREKAQLLAEKFSALFLREDVRAHLKEFAKACPQFILALAGQDFLGGMRQYFTTNAYFAEVKRPALESYGSSSTCEEKGFSFVDMTEQPPGEWIRILGPEHRVIPVEIFRSSDTSIRGVDDDAMYSKIDTGTDFLVLHGLEVLRRLDRNKYQYVIYVEV